MRALLVVNPAATTTTDRSRHVIVSALQHQLSLKVVQTTHRGHARALAARAVEDGLDIVLALGGDGTVHEVVNGLLPRGPRMGPPDLAVVPGGSTNVFARAAGLPRDPVEATGLVLEAVRSGRRRPLGLGRAEETWFTFCAGMGFDAEVIDAVDHHRARGRRSTGTLYLSSAVRRFFRGTERSSPGITVRRPGREPVPDIFLLIVQNTSPWTYLGERPVSPSPSASFDTGLDLVALTGLGTLSTVRHARQFLSGSSRATRGRHAVAMQDLAEFTATASRPVAWQLDGEYLGDIQEMTFRAVPNAIRLLA